MIKVTDLIKKDYRYITSDNEEYCSLNTACYMEAYNLINFKSKSKNIEFDAVGDYLREKEKRIQRLATRFEREFSIEDVRKMENDIFHFTLFLQFEPTLKEVMRAFREDVIFYGNVNINSINEIKKDFKENHKRVSDIRAFFNKGYGAYLVKARFSKGDFEEPSYWDVEVISHFKF